MSTAGTQKSRIIQAQNDHYAISHDPLVDSTHRELAKAFAVLKPPVRPECTPWARSTRAHAKPMSLSGAHHPSCFKALGRASTGANLANKYEIDVFSCRHRHSEIHSHYAGSTTVVSRKVTLNYTLCSGSLAEL